jgi:hypothetical protein
LAIKLDMPGAAFDAFDRDQDAILIIEVREKATYVPQNTNRGVSGC